MSRWLGRLACLAAGLLVALLAGEGIARVGGIGNVTMSRGGLLAFHPEAGWMCQPGCDTRYEMLGNFNVRVLCNSRGLRDRERSLAKPPGMQRLVALGDSFMWGYGVENEQMFTSRLEGLLEHTEVLNFGVNGYSTVQELVRLETDGLAYAPDTAVLSFCWNDLDSNLDDKEGGRPAVELGSDGEVRIVNRPVREAWKSGTKQWLRHNSRLVAALDYVTALQRMRRRMQATADAGAMRPDSAEAERQDTEVRESEFTLLDLFGPPTSEVDRAWLVFQSLIGRIRDRMNESGGKVLVVFVAIREARSEEAFRAALVARYENSDRPLDLDWDRPAQRLRGICDELGIPFLDLNPVFRAYDRPDELFLPTNGHWSAAGHALAAEAVADKLSASGLAVRRQPGTTSH